VTSGAAPGIIESAESAILGTENTVLVAVHITPPNAVVFKGGERFGTGDVTLEVARGAKTKLFARLDGYLPRTIVVDGTKSSVNIVLSRAQSARPTVARKQPAQEATASSPRSDEPSPAPAGEPSDTPSDSVKAFDPEPTKRSPPTSTLGSDPMSNPY